MKKEIDEKKLAEIRKRSAEKAKEWQKWLEDNGWQEVAIY